MKKRLLSAFMALALCLTLLPAPAWAKEADAQTQTGTSGTVYTVDADTAVQSVENDVVVQAEGSAVADVDGTTYSDLITAFDAAQEKPSATVKLLVDVATNGLSSLTHRGTGTGAGNYIFDQGNVTFDLNGHTLTWTKYDAYRTSLVVGDNGRLTIRDSGTGGKIYNEETQALQIYAGTLNIQSGTVVSKSNKALKIIGGDVSITGGTIHSDHYSGEGVSISPDTVNNSTATLTISGDAKLIGGTNGSGLYVARISDENPLVKLSGGTYTGGSSGINCHNTTVGTLLDEGCRYMLGGSEVTDTGVSTLGSGVTVEANPNAPVKYIDADGNEARANCTEITVSTNDISTQGWYVVKENLTISLLNISGEVNLILCNGATLTVSNNMNVTEGSTLNLYWQSAGSGKLTAAAISVLGTVTAPAGEMKKTTGDSSTTFEKCKDHLWTYTNNSENHTTRCDLCGKDGGAVNHSYTGWTDNGDGTHTGKCVCGAESTEQHTLALTPNADDLTHSGKCGVCGYAAAAESHNFDQTDEYGKKCECGAYLAAEYNGQQYATLARAIEAAKNGGTVTLQMDVGERITVNDGMNVTINLNNNRWTTDGNTAHATLVVTGGSVTVQNGELTSGTSSNAYTAVEVEGGKLTVGENMTIQGGSMDANRQFPAIDVKGGELVLSVGAMLNGGLKVPEGKQLKDYLPEGTAFRLRSYDESTGTWTEDKDLLNAYTTNVYNVPNMALVVVEHTKHEFAWNSDGKYVCACGYTCPHNDFKDGKCTICSNECAHTNVDENGLCRNCKTQMAVKSETGGTVTYGTDFAAAMRNATNGTKITLLADVSISGRTGISGDNTTVTLNLNEHKITSGWLDVGGKDTNGTYTACTLKIIGKGSYEPPMYGGIITVDMKATLDLSEWEGGTISSINISDNSNYEAATREAAVIIGPKAGTIGELSFGNNQLEKLTKTRLSGGSFNEIWVADFGPVKLGELLAEGYAYQKADGSYVEYGRTLQGTSIYNVKVVKCLHPNMKPDAATGIATCEYCGKSGEFVASVDGNLYSDMDEAITYWLKNGGTLKLYADYTAADGTWKVGSGSHTINLNGHKMSVQNGGTFKPTNNMHLTVTNGMEFGHIENILLDGNQGGSFTLESGYVGNLKMTGGAVVALKGGSVDKLDVQNCSANTNLSIQGGSIGQLNIRDWADGMHVSATGGSLGAYDLPSGKILADVLDHQYYAEGTSLDRHEDTAQPGKKFDVKQAPHDFGSTTSKAADVPINGSIPFRVGSPSGNVGVYDVKWYRRTNSGAEHMTENKVAGVNVNDTLDVFCVITGLDRPGGAMQWQVAVKGYTIKVVPAKLNGATVTLDHDSFVFDGNSHTPTVTSVTLDNKALANDDYTVSVDKKTNAGTYELIVAGTKNYTGTVRVPWTIQPHTIGAPVSGSTLTVTKTYDGTATVSTDDLEETNVKFKSIAGITGISEMTLARGKDFKISGHYDAADAGDNLGADITITLTEGGNYTFKDAKTGEDSPTATLRGIGTITPATVSTEAKPYDLYVVNNLEREYLIDPAKLLPKLESPKKYGEVAYALDANMLESAYYAVGTATIENGRLILPIKAVETKETGNIGSVQVKVSTTNYHDSTLTINVNATNKIVPTGEPTLSTKTLTYGQALSAIKLSGTMKDDGKTVPGTFAWVDGTVKPNAGSYEAAWKFTPADGDTYTEADGTVTITVNEAKPTGEPIYTRITAANKTLKDAALKPNTSWPTGTIQWVDKDGKELPDTTEVKANTAYKWIFTPDAEFAANYTTATGELTLYSVSTGGSSSVSTVKTDTVTNPDGSVTKTETKKDGTKVETTTGKDGSVSKTTTNPNGSSVTETKAADGSTATVKTDKNGQTTAETALSSKAIETAKRNGEPVKAPVEVKATRNSDTAPTVKIELPRNSGDTKVEIPVSNVKPGTVAVLVHPDGTEEIIKNSLPTEDGIQLTVNGGATVKIVDNSKDFADTRNHWAKDAIDFVSARGLVNGMSATIYAPNASTTRAQLWTILARQNDADLNGGATWFENAQNWAKAKGISDGANPNAAINRAQMVTMLWRAMGQPAAASGASFADVPADSYYAQAVAWAIENGITAGVGGGRFDPNSTCTRGQIATFLWRAMAE